MGTSPASADRPSTSVPPVFLHIGAMKSGTTYLQQVLLDHKEQLAGSGYLFPGATWRDQVRAAQDLAHAIPPDSVIRAEAAGAWEALAGRMRRHRGVASIVSMEFLTHARARHVLAALDSLAPAEVHVILTLRDATRTIPSQWQTSVRSKNTSSWDDFRIGVRRAAGLRARLGRLSDPTALKFRRNHDVPRILEAWGEGVPAERLHVITVPVPASKADPALLWDRFAGVVGLDPQLGTDSPSANESLGYASAELLRRVNLELDDVPLHDHYAIVREHLAKRILSRRSEVETRPRLDQATFDFGLRWNQRTHDSVQRAGVHVVGDLDEDLPTSPTERHRGAVDDEQAPPTAQELLEAAAAAAAGMRDLLDRQRRRASKRGRAVETPHLAASGPAAGRASKDPVAAAISEIAAQCRASIELRRQLRA